MSRPPAGDASQREAVFDRLRATRAAAGTVEEHVAGRYLFAVARPHRRRRANVQKIGAFAVVDGGRLGVLDRAAFRGIAAEAREHGILPPFHVYCRICTYSGPNLEIFQGTEGLGA